MAVALVGARWVRRRIRADEGGGLVSVRRSVAPGATGRASRPGCRVTRRL